MNLSERKNKILTSVIERYIVTGEPVGSKVLCEGMNVSSATVRNEMSELSEIGYLEQPHTSAGRIPSQKGLRYYVDNLMHIYEISDADKYMVENRFGQLNAEPNEILSEAAAILSEITGCAALALTPYDLNAFIKRVELVPVSSKTVMVVLLMSTGVIKSKMCRCDSGIDMTDAELFYNISAAHFIGRMPEELTVPVIQCLAVSLGDKVLSMAPLLLTLTQLAYEASRFSLLTEGQSNLLSHKELETDVYSIFEHLKRANVIAQILNQSPDDLNITIGRESMNRAFENVSVISSKYAVDGKNVGSMGIIGPLRLDYARVIPSIQYISKTVGNVLTDIIEE